MSFRVTIIVLLTQLCVVAVTSSDVNCMSLTHEVKDQEYKKSLAIECRVEACYEINYFNIIRYIEISSDFAGVVGRIEKNVPTGIKDAVLTGSTSDTMSAFLKVEIANPTVEDAGQYTCLIGLQDLYGKKKDLQANIVIDASDLPSKDYYQTKVCNKTDEYKPQYDKCKLYRQGLVDLFFQKTKSYNGRTYYLSKGPFLNDEESDLLCQIVGGYLVEVDDEDEFKAMVELIKEAKATGSLISGTDAEKERTWLYHRSEKEMTYFNWLKPAPDNLQGKENCLVIWIKEDYAIGMNDVICHSNPFKLPFICETEESYGYSTSDAS